MWLIGIFALILPVSFSFWVFTILSNWFQPSASDLVPTSPLRWTLSVVIPVLIATWGLKRKSVNRSGAIAGVVIGFLLTISNYAFLASLLAFFVSSTKATKYGSKKKESIEEDFKVGGQRNWIQVICNGGVAAEMAILYMIEIGITESAIDFRNNYVSSWLSIAVLASIAGANGDTWASELGAVFSKGDPVLITSLKPVPRGTNGGVSLPGLLVSLLGGILVGVMYYAALLLFLTRDILSFCPPQWPVILAGGLAGIFDSLVDSLLGATLQFSGINKKSGKIVERPGPDVKYISGVAFLDNHSVNLLSSFISAIVVPFASVYIWNVLG